MEAIALPKNNPEQSTTRTSLSTTSSTEIRGHSDVTSGAQNDVKEKLAVRLGALDLTRCTEQTSIVASLLMGHGIGGHDAEDRGMYRPTVGRLLLRTLLGYLADTHFDIRFAELQETAPFYCRSDYVRQIWKPFREFVQSRDKPELELELLTIPVDGLGDHLRGHAGAVSFLVGGPPGSFCPLYERDSQGKIVSDIQGRRKSRFADDYLTVCVSPEIATSFDSGAESFDANSCLEPNGENDFADVVSVVMRIIDQAWRHSSKRREQFTVGTLEGKEVSPFRKRLGVKWRLQTFSGSPVSGATSVCLGTLGIDAFAAILKPIEVAIISAAAMATGGQVFHIPVMQMEFKELNPKEWVPVRTNEVVDKKKFKTKNVAHVCESKFGGASAFIASDKDLFVIATGIGESSMLNGVRYQSSNVSSTHTLCICSHTRSTRFLTLHHNLRRRKYVVMTEDCGQVEWLDYKQLSRIVTDMLSGGGAITEK